MYNIDQRLYLITRYMEVSINGGTPIAGCSLQNPTKMDAFAPLFQETPT